MEVLGLSIADPMDPLESSQKIIKHGPRQRPVEIAIGDNETIDTVARHIERSIERRPAPSMFQKNKTRANFQGGAACLLEPV